ncbi:MAG TPA: hemolysin family protein [Candidatus Saccharimonadales bacterium]|nr:hemolysin family protein [Candidatus Saccharimonadales bacterium]
MLELAFLIISILLVLACGMFVAAEFSLIAVNRSSVEQLAKKGDRKAKGVEEALKTLSSQLSGAQVGITITNLGIGFLAEPSLSALLRGPLGSVGMEGAALTSISIVLGITIATIVTMIFGELVPKNLAIAKPLKTARYSQKFQRNFSAFMARPIKILNGSANFILKKIGVEPQEELASARSADELSSLVRRSAEKGTLPKDTAQMVERSLSFGDQTALDVMTPRVQMSAVSSEDPVSKVIDVSKSSGHSKFPVYKKDIDNIVGIVHIKKAVGIPMNKRNNTKVSKIMDAPVMVPSNIELDPLLNSLKKSGMQLAVVIDEFGGTDGVVAIEDLIEEIVGELHDEHDDKTEIPIIKKGRNRWILSGLLRPDEISEELGILLPDEDDFETIAGLVTDRLKKIPEKGDKVLIAGRNEDNEACSVELKVEGMDNNRIDEISVRIVKDKENF